MVRKRLSIRALSDLADKWPDPRTPEWITGQLAKLLAHKGLRFDQLSWHAEKLVEIMRSQEMYPSEGPKKRAKWLESLIVEQLKSVAAEITAWHPEDEASTLKGLLILFGLKGKYAGIKLAERRDAAANELNIRPETLRVKYQALYVEALAERLYNLLP